MFDFIVGGLKFEPQSILDLNTVGLVRIILAPLLWLLEDPSIYKTQVGIDGCNSCGRSVEHTPLLDLPNR